MQFISLKCNKNDKKKTKSSLLTCRKICITLITLWLTDYIYFQMALVSVNLYITHEIDTRLLIERVCVCYQTKELKSGIFAG